MRQSAKYIQDAWLITAISNLHAGSGDARYGIIDKEVQRDAISERPTINASSFKGACRELFSHLLNESADQDHPDIEYIFGSGKGSAVGRGSGDNGDQQNAAGHYNFYRSHLLVLPVRSDKAPFFRATCPAILKEFLYQLEQFDVDTNKYKTGIEEVLLQVEPKKGEPIIFEQYNNILLEDLKAKVEGGAIGTAYGEHYNTLTELLGDNLAIFHNDDFKTLCGELPVIARNYLENGVSKNLWYEEVVPRESRFYCIISRPAGDDKFASILAQNKNHIQIGGNASVGYGYSSIQKIPTT